MAFVIADEVKLRYDNNGLLQWTNPGANTNATSINVAAIDAAFEDAKGDFRAFAGTEFVETDNRMIGLACDLVVFYLKLRAGSPGDFQTTRQILVTRLETLRKVTHRDTAVPAATTHNFGVRTSDDPIFTRGRLETHGFPETGQSSDTSYNNDFP